uniref:F-box/LRR-repeat protein At3g48880 n=1 Tax=Anthurium amnicola TaxID=1678845 RepID=A0A1D1Z562_9ARAE
MAPEGKRPRWEDLNRDLLVSVFARLGVEDLIGGVSLACTAWCDAARDPRCWKDLDFRRWQPISRRLRCRREPPVDFLDLLDFAIGRARGAVDSVRFPDFADELDLLYVAERCPILHYFSLANDDIPMDQFCKAIDKLEFLEGMAVNESLISVEVLQHIKRSCAYFSELEVFAECVDERMGTVICEALPHLRKLKLNDCFLSQQVISLLLDKLKDLEYFDISGYNTPGITGVVLEKASRLKEFRWDSKFDEGEFDYCSGCEEDIFFQNPCECMLDKQITEWLALHS